MGGGGGGGGGEACKAQQVPLILEKQASGLGLEEGNLSMKCATHMHTQR